MTTSNKTITIDGLEARGEKFIKCHFVYSGGQPPTLEGCSFDDCTFEFAGAAGTTMGVLSAFYHGGFRKIVEQTFENIRANKLSALAKQRLH